MKNVEAVFVGSDPDGVSRFITRCCENVTFSEITNPEIAESCTIPPRGNGVLLNAKVRDEEVMRVVHEILRIFGAPQTDKDQESTDHTYRLASIGISNGDSVGAHSSRVLGASSHL